MYFVFCILYLYFVFVFGFGYCICICILYLDIVFVFCICILYLYFVFVFCICILYLHFVFVFCICIHLSLCMLYVYLNTFCDKYLYLVFEIGPTFVTVGVAHCVFGQFLLFILQAFFVRDKKNK